MFLASRACAQRKRQEFSDVADHSTCTSFVSMRPSPALEKVVRDGSAGGAAVGRSLMPIANHVCEFRRWLACQQQSLLPSFSKCGARPQRWDAYERP